MLPGMVTGNRMRGLNLDVPSVTSTITVLVHQNALTAGNLATWPRTGTPATLGDLPPVETKNQGNVSGVARALQWSRKGNKPDINVCDGPPYLDHGYNVD
ncbi:hypothetical protein Tco_1054053 [Tanacetum coccineum]|uniref:Uncharacterized protein n=1 Tax=Tanacetum coccineum TaxID=301880 RepID=A0ABQ5GVP6_9ASTR